MFFALQVCREDGEQWCPGPGDAGAEGVARRPAHPQHGEERGGVHVAARPQTNPGPGIDGPPHTHTHISPPSFREGKKGEQRFIKSSQI